MAVYVFIFSSIYGENLVIGTLKIPKNDEILLNTAVLRVIESTYDYCDVFVDD